MIRLLPQSFFGPRRCFIVAAPDEMSESRPTLHSNDIRIEWAQSHPMGEMIDRNIRLAAPNSYPAARIPCSREIRIEYKCAINESGTSSYVGGAKSDRVSGTREGHRIVRTQLRGSSSQPGSFSNFFCAVTRPAVNLAPSIAPRCHSIGRGEIGIEFDSLVE